MNVKKNTDSELLFDFEKMDICKRSIDFIEKICDLIEDENTFTGKRITDQLVRASNSIALNVGEGYGSYYKGTKKKHYRIARGSIFECVIALRICERRKIIEKNNFNELYHDCFDMSRMISGLIKSVDKRIN
jgi:four helix bundle protein